MSPGRRKAPRSNSSERQKVSEVESFQLVNLNYEI